MNARDRFHAQIMSALNDKSEQERSKMVMLHDAWREDGHYKYGDVRRRGEVLYKCLIEHDAQPTWTPEDSPSIWVRIMYKEGIRIIPEIIEATQAFALDECGWWGDVLYRSLINGNVYTPDQYPAGWEEVT